MKKKFFGLLFLVTVFLITGAFCLPDADAEVNVNIGINVPLPRLVISVPPAVVLIPGTYAYFAPDIEVDILFYSGYWYRPYESRWYRAGHYNGPWKYIVVDKVPRVLIDLPPGYRHIPPGHERIPYGHLKKNWSTWEREKHWDRKHEYREFKHEKREQHREERREHREDRDKGRGKR